VVGVGGVCGDAVRGWTPDRVGGDKFLSCPRMRVSKLPFDANAHDGC
jgi:hypothetical protein